MTLTGFLTYTLALGIAAAIPGPGVIALVARALGSGFRSALVMSLGLIAGDLPPSRDCIAVQGRLARLPHAVQFGTDERIAD